MGIPGVGVNPPAVPFQVAPVVDEERQRCRNAQIAPTRGLGEWVVPDSRRFPLKYCGNDSGGGCGGNDDGSLILSVIKQIMWLGNPGLTNQNCPKNCALNINFGI